MRALFSAAPSYCSPLLVLAGTRRGGGVDDLLARVADVLRVERRHRVAHGGGASTRINASGGWQTARRMLISSRRGGIKSVGAADRRRMRTGHSSAACLLRAGRLVRKRLRFALARVLAARSSARMPEGNACNGRPPDNRGLTATSVAAGCRCVVYDNARVAWQTRISTAGGVLVISSRPANRLPIVSRCASVRMNNSDAAAAPAAAACCAAYAERQRAERAKNGAQDKYRRALLPWHDDAVSPASLLATGVNINILPRWANIWRINVLPAG